MGPNYMESFHTKLAKIWEISGDLSDFYEIFIIWYYHWSMKNLKISAFYLQPFPGHLLLKNIFKMEANS